MTPTTISLQRSRRPRTHDAVGRARIKILVLQGLLHRYDLRVRPRHPHARSLTRAGVVGQLILDHADAGPPRGPLAAPGPRLAGLAQPSTTRTLWVAPSSVSRSGPPPEARGVPSTSTLETPRETPRGFSTASL